MRFWMLTALAGLLLTPALARAEPLRVCWLPTRPENAAATIELDWTSIEAPPAADAAPPVYDAVQQILASGEAREPADWRDGRKAETAFASLAVATPSLLEEAWHSEAELRISAPLQAKVDLLEKQFAGQRAAPHRVAEPLPVILAGLGAAMLIAAAMVRGRIGIG